MKETDDTDKYRRVLNYFTRIPVSLKARLHRRFLSRQLGAIFVALKLHQVSNMFETPAIGDKSH